MIIKLLFSLLLAVHWTAYAETQTLGVEANEGFKLEKVLDGKNIHDFTWDDHGVLWVLSSGKNSFTVSMVPNLRNAEVKSVHTIRKSKNGQGSLLVSGNTIYVSNGGQIHILPINNRSEKAKAYVPLANLFPAQSRIHSLAWSPLGGIYFLYQSSVTFEAGIGRVNLQGSQWDIVAKGNFKNLGFDGNNFLIAKGVGSSNLFRVAFGLDYDRGLETYQKSDLALKSDKPNLHSAFATIYSGAAWPEENSETWLVWDVASSAIQQFKEQSGTLIHWRPLVHLASGLALRELQVGPDGAAWLLISGEKESSRIFRLAASSTTEKPTPSKVLTKLSNDELAAELGNPNSWHRDAAMRILDQREDLRNARGLHPKTPLYGIATEKTNSPSRRIAAMLSLHRLKLMDEVTIESTADDSDPMVKAWTAILIGERNYPTGVAFDKLIKLSKDTNMVVRSAAAIAARQFVSGSLALDTPPKSMPIREVWTGGILSTLWFSTKNGSTPEFDLLFWNAVRPITAYDHAHPMGFFNGDNDRQLALAYWTVGLITRQIAESDHPLKQEEAMIMVSELDPKNPKMIIAALRGLKNGSANRKVTPTKQSLKVLGDLSQSTNEEIATLSQEIHRHWQKPISR